MTQLLTNPFGRAATLDGKPLELGGRTRLTLTHNGKIAWDSLAKPSDSPGSNVKGYDCVYTRVDVKVGIDMVPTLTPTIKGWEAAKYLKENFNRQDEIEVKVSFEDVGEPGEPLFERRIFAGQVLQATPSMLFPGQVELQIDAPMYKARELQTVAAAKGDGNSDHFRDSLERLGISTNFLAEESKPSQEGTKAEDPNQTLLDYINDWCEFNSMHYADLMDGNLVFFFPRDGRATYFGQKNMDWVIPIAGIQDRKELAAIMKVWNPRENYVDTPSKITAVWAKPDQLDSPKLIEKDIENGRKDYTISLGLLRAGSEPEAQNILKALVGEYLWRSVTGDFELAVGLPILPFDDIAATNGPPGLEEYYDTFFRVTYSHLTYELNGLSTRGAFRAIP